MKSACIRPALPSVLTVLVALLLSLSGLYAQPADPMHKSAAAAGNATAIAALRKEADALWTVIAACLVFLMQAGFALVEAGFTRARNAVNILMKNLADMFMGSIAFFLVGFALMFGPPLVESFGIGVPSFADRLLTTGPAGVPDGSKYAFFLFQLVFCATAVTIASGAMAERTRFAGYLIYSAVISALIYPVFGSLTWGDLFGNPKGYLAALGFIDFAGSTVVHSVGGWLGLAGAIVLGPRVGKFDRKRGIVPIFGHNLSLATLGVFLLWFGWFGFNAGSTTALAGSSFAMIAAATQMAAAGGALGAMLLSWLLYRRADITMVLNGALAGLVGITAGCNNVSLSSAIWIGLVAGCIAVLGVIALDHARIDDPVGAVTVHGLAGAWGTLAVGLFAQHQFGGGPNGWFYGGGFSLLKVQAIGVGLAFFWAFGAGLILFLLLHYTIGLRVSPETELEGLDLMEHGAQAYPEG